MVDRSRLNLIVVQIFIASLMVALLGRLFYLQIADGPRYREAALNIQSRDIVTPANRGVIVDDIGTPIAINHAGLVVTVDRSIIDKTPDKGVAILQKVAVVLGLNYNDVYIRTRLCPELPKGDRAGCWNGTRYQPIPVTKEATQGQALNILEHSDIFPGVNAEPISIRNYPSLEGENIAHVLGYVGPVTEADMNNGKGINYFRNELIGKSGLEYQYDSILRGTAGIKTVIVDRKEAITQQSRDTKPIPGDNLILNINAKLQAAVEKELYASILRGRSLGHRADSGAAIVLDVKTGAVLAMASYPTYDPNIWENGITVAQAKNLYSEKSAVPALSRAVQGAFAPASTFKVISTAAAVRAGYSTDASYNCPATVQIGNREFKNFDSKAAGRISLKTAIAISCDSLWYQVAYDEWVRDGGLRPKANANDYFFTTAKGFGLGKKTGIDLPSEISGRLPDRQWKLDWYGQNKDFYCNYRDRAKKSQLTPLLIDIARENCIDGDKVRAGDAVNFSIGQGDTLMTPLQLGVAYAAIANGGTLYQPQIAKAIVKSDGTLVKKFEPVVTGKIPADKKTIDFLHSALRAVVTSGTGAGSFAGLPVAVSGKTGTAQVFGKNWDGSSKADTSWFASFAPSDKPQYAVVMVVSQGGFGASTSGVGVRKIYEAIFGTNGQKSVMPMGVPSTLPNIDVTKFGALKKVAMP